MTTTPRPSNIFCQAHYEVAPFRDSPSAIQDRFRAVGRIELQGVLGRREAGQDSTCLVEAPSPEAATAVHREAHGLVANHVREVTADNGDWRVAGPKAVPRRHHLGAGKVTAKDVAAAHHKDLAVQVKHDMVFLNYWFDEGTGTVSCLVEAPTAADAIAAHKEAHGLLPDTIDEVIEGR